MARGKSGRIVVEIDAEVKRRLYTALAARTLTLKEWFLQEVHVLLEEPEKASTPPPTRPSKDRPR